MGAAVVQPAPHPLPFYELAGIAPVAKATGNAGGKTVALKQYDAPAGSDGHFVLFEVPQAEKDSTDFLDALARGQTPVVE